jgi:hypothetical protein
MDTAAFVSGKALVAGSIGDSPAASALRLTVFEYRDWLLPDFNEPRT